MRKLNKEKALVLFSGGQDSSIALAWALSRFQEVETIGFNYGQRHAIELGARQALRRALSVETPKLAENLGADTLVYAAGIRDLGQTAMTHETAIELGEEGLPTTFVPGRNLVFFSLAGGLAYRRNAGVLVGGMCEADFSGYPDCRESAIQAQAEALRQGMDVDIEIATPLMHETKSASWRLAYEIGGETLVELINEHSHTCYRGIRSQRHEWGYGCGDCPACELRKRGWEGYVAGR